jgi:hypothetical protein
MQLSSYRWRSFPSYNVKRSGLRRRPENIGEKLVNQNYLGALLLLLACFSLHAQDKVTFEDEPTSTPSVTRTKGAASGRPATLSASGIAFGPVKTSVPVLLPTAERLLQGIQFISDPISYTATYTTVGATISIFGTRRVAVLDLQNTRNPQGPSKTPLVIDKTEFGYTASFKEFGANYLLTLECSQRRDVRCSKPTFIYSVANGLSVYLQE